MALDLTEFLIDPAFAIGNVDPRLFGSFIEHLGRCVYEGVYDPESPLADVKGIRQDVVAASQEMGVTVMRYPGGNFVSNYDWRDGIGPRRERPIRKDLAWRTLESNHFGTDEFLRLCERAGWIPMMTCNLGTGTLREALDWFQYCNDLQGQTTLAKQREANGHVAPYPAKLWCLGNEMDGPWQLGQKPPEMYAADAKAVAKLFKDGDSEVETVVAGSSGYLMSTFAQWDATVLDIVGDGADYIALHAYMENRVNDTQSFLFSADLIRRQIAAVDAVCVASAARRKSTKRTLLSFDEWNVWYRHVSGAREWQYAPHLCEEPYNLEDAIVVSDILHAFLERADVLKIANIAQLVNVIAPMWTRRDALLRHSTFYAFRMFSQRGQGRSLRIARRGPKHEFVRDGMRQRSRFVVSSAMLGDGKLQLLFTNRSQHEAAPVAMRVRDLELGTVVGEILTGSDPKLGNTWESPNEVVPVAFDGAVLSGDTVRLELPPMSLVALTVDVA